MIWVVRAGDDLYVRSAHGEGMTAPPRPPWDATPLAQSDDQQFYAAFARSAAIIVVLRRP
jgi:hypothetical protein